MISKTNISVLYFIFLVLDGVTSVQINYIKVPAAVKNNSKRPTIMDCDYSLRPDDTDPVVKWYLNDVLVYQWIPPQRPQSFGPLKDRLDLAYMATDDPRSAYRAMKIENPTDDVAGEYKCFVSTFTDEDFSIRNMKIFVPEKTIDLFKSSFDERYINFTCLVSQVYPSPKLLIHETYKDELNKNRLPTIHGEVTKHNTGLFSSYIIASASTETLNPGSLILCEVRIPGTGYVRIKSLLYYPEGNNFNLTATWKWCCIFSLFSCLSNLFDSHFK